MEWLWTWFTAKHIICNSWWRQFKSRKRIQNSKLQYRYGVSY